MSSETRFNSENFKKLSADLDRDGTLYCVITSDSMSPIINTGDMISVAPLNRQPNIFDILVFLQNDILVCHMFIKESNLKDEMGGAIFLTKSYKYKNFDLPVSKSNVLGIVSSHRVSFWRKLYYLMLKN